MAFLTFLYFVTISNQSMCSTIALHTLKWIGVNKTFYQWIVFLSFSFHATFSFCNSIIVRMRKSFDFRFICLASFNCLPKRGEIKHCCLGQSNLNGYQWTEVTINTCGNCCCFIVKTESCVHNPLKTKEIIITILWVP